MSEYHDTYADERIDWKAERQACAAVILRYVPGAVSAMMAEWPTYFLQRMSACDATWWDAAPEYRWFNILFNAKREGLRHD